MEENNADVMIDHINGNPLDNRKQNLRKSNSQLNGQNKSKQANTSSSFIGVSKNRKQWQVIVIHGGKTVYRSNFEDEIMAARKRDLYIINNLPNTHYKMNFVWTEEDIKTWTEK